LGSASVASEGTIEGAMRTTIACVALALFGAACGGSNEPRPAIAPRPPSSGPLPRSRT
jgi:hypothetical protein